MRQVTQDFDDWSFAKILRQISVVWHCYSLIICCFSSNTLQLYPVNPGNIKVASKQAYYGK